MKNIHSIFCCIFCLLWNCLDTTIVIQNPFHRHFENAKKRLPFSCQLHTVKPGTHLAILYADRRDRRIKWPISGMSDIGDYIQRYSSSMPVPAIFYAHCCESPVKLTNQVGRFYHITFQNVPRWSQGTRLKCHIAAIGEKKSPGVSASIGGQNRLRFSLSIKFAAIDE